MKITGALAIAALAGASLGAESEPTKATVTVCIESDPHIPKGTLPLAAKIFASIGVRIDWREHRCPIGVGAIVVSLSYGGPDNTVTNDLGFAQPYDGTHVVVFPDRVLRFDPYQRPCILAHVLVHEITHVLQRISRHSATGIMKARWDHGDYVEMGRNTLPFTQEDIDLIYIGLKMRQARLTAARSE